MACLINNGLLNDQCQFLIGGLKNIYLANADEVTSITDTDTDDILDTITMTSGSTFYKFDLSKDTSSSTEVLTVSNGNKYILSTITFVVPKSDTEAILTAEKLALGKFVAITETRMGKYKVFGLTNPLEATVGELNSGAGEGDSAGLNFQLAGAQLGYAREFDGVIPV